MAETDILKLWKVEGETPLECLQRFRSENPGWEGVPMTYAGRLDPMAEGLLLVLAGDIDEEDKKKLLKLDKVYEFEILWGFETDTYDLLGLVESVGETPKEDEILKQVEKYIGNRVQKYPAFSSKPVNGKPLFSYARSGTLDDVDLPEREVTVFSLDVLSSSKVMGIDLLKSTMERILNVKGDFRQEEIIERWRNILSVKGSSEFLITKIVAKVSSGTYIRSIAHGLGKNMGSGACAYSIKRTQIGDYKI